MSIKPLELTVKLAILQAIEEAGFNVPLAARGLRVGKGTVYRYLRDWGLEPPLYSGDAHGRYTFGAKVLRSDYMERCRLIHQALLEAKAQ
jgi:DNA-binding IclR family transcriptional regulator